MSSSGERFVNASFDPEVRGFLHRAGNPRAALVLSHGAGGNCQAPLLIELAEAFANTGFTVLRCDLPFRQSRPYGPPGPGTAGRDREGLKRAVNVMRSEVPGRIFLGGHSYGGRQATMQCAEEPKLADGLLLLSYPLHPPRKLAQLRTQHLPGLFTPALFVHGTRDPFGSIEELDSSLRLIPAAKRLMAVEGEGHDLGFKGKSRRDGLAAEVLKVFHSFFQI